MRNSIRTQLAIAFIALTAGLLVIVGVVLAWQSYIAEERKAVNLQSEVAQRISLQVSSYMLTQQNALQELVQVRGLSNLDRDQQTQLFTEMLSYSDAFDKLTLLNSYGQEQVIVSRTEVGIQLRDRSTADEFKSPKAEGQVYYGPVQYSEATGEPFLVIGVPFVNVKSGVVTGVLVADVRFKPVWDLLASTTLGQGNSAYIVDAKNQVIAHNNPSVVLRNTLFTVPSQNGIFTGVGGTSVVLASKNVTFGKQEFTIVSETPTSKALADVLNSELTLAGILLVAIVIAGVLGVVTARQIVLPIEALAATARLISTGDLTQQAKVTRRDEIGNLAETLNRMTVQLRDLIGSLEQRVADRTKALATSSDVSRRISTILDQKELVTEVVNQVKDAFGYYHTQIYFYDEANENLVMAGGTGEAGEQMLAQFHKVAKGRGLVGRAAESNQAVLVSDTSKNPEWLPNALLPATESEAAIPISLGDQVLGVLDVQHNVANGLQQEDVDLLQSIANQVAVAVQNIRQYEKTRKIAADMGVVANVGIATSTITDSRHLLQEVVDLSKNSFNLYHAHIYLLNEAGDLLELASGAGEVGRQMVSETRSIPLDSEQSLVARAARSLNGVVVNDVTVDPTFLPNPLLPETRSEMAVPMIVAGKVIGVLDVQSETTNRFTEVDVSIQTTLASQVAVALQNARSFSQTQQHAERETTLNLITQRIQNATSVEAALQIAARELGRSLGMKPTLVSLDPAALADEHKVNT
jgi:GAF domain-containing protein/HAMP domain-containing protein